MVGRGPGHGHPPAPREFRLVPLDQKGGCGRSCDNAGIASRAEASSAGNHDSCVSALFTDAMHVLSQ